MCVWIPSNVVDGIPEMAFLNGTGLIFFFFSLFFVWIGTDSFLWFEVFILQVSCVLQIFQHIPFLCAGELQDTAVPMEWENVPGTRRSWFAFPECFVHVLAQCWRGGRRELRPWNPQIPPPALLRTCREPSTGHSTPSIPSSVAGDDLSVFFWEQSKILHSRHWQVGRAGCFSQRNSLSPGLTLQLLGLHRAHYSLLSPLGFQLNNCSETEKLGVLPAGLKYFVCLTVSESSLSKRCGNRTVLSSFVRICTSFLV